MDVRDYLYGSGLIGGDPTTRSPIPGARSEPLRITAIPFRKKPEDGAKKAPAVVHRQSRRALPYFGHQQLDLDYFPKRE